ncbi:MAG: RNA-binding S4 domain-containing protein [Armatimonadota bacterium]|nr:RNA-binding S4 domain-containing protein [Armatimonadota bacterium]MDR7518171.1 RNA-binding S4 domain-containing protein [Armatimonadota bacterium]MDR7548926.1 RNA-binding S4 domain-containing protein [Armatimonadota bacterium]
MRLDKFLQASRLVRRRALANRLCDAGRVTLNGRQAKPAAEVEEGDLIGVHFGTRRTVVKVRRLPTGRPSTEPVYEVVEDRREPDTW